VIQGYPLSPFLFLIMVEALSKLINDAKENGDLKGVKVIEQEYISHCIFVDDVV
jgi:hypothetical protein